MSETGSLVARPVLVWQGDGCFDTPSARRQAASTSRVLLLRIGEQMTIDVALEANPCIENAGAISSQSAVRCMSWKQERASADTNAGEICTETYDWMSHQNPFYCYDW